MGIMDQFWILLSAGAVWVMVREAEKVDRREDARQRIAANRCLMRQRLSRSVRKNTCSTELLRLGTSNRKKN